MFVVCTTPQGLHHSDYLSWHACKYEQISHTLRRLDSFQLTGPATLNNIPRAFTAKAWRTHGCLFITNSDDCIAHILTLISAHISEQLHLSQGLIIPTKEGSVQRILRCGCRFLLCIAFPTCGCVLEQIYCIVFL